MPFSSEDLKKLSTLKVNGNELYDLTVPGMQEMYDNVVRTTSAHAISRDTSSFAEIKESVLSATQKHVGDGIVILSGAYPHMIGAVAVLQKDFNIEYVPVSGAQISTATKDSRGMANIKGSDTLTEKDLKLQIERDIGVTKTLGYDTMESLRAAIELTTHDPKKKTLVVIGLNETGLHGLDEYFENSHRVYAALEKTIANLDQKPGFVTYIAEDLNVTSLKHEVTSSTQSDYLRNAFLQKLHQSGIPVEIGAFGHRDRVHNQQNSTIGTLNKESQSSPYTTLLHEELSIYPPQTRVLILDKMAQNILQPSKIAPDHENGFNA